MKKICARFTAPSVRGFRINTALLALVTLAAGCSRVEVEQVENPGQNGEPVILVDRTGKRWDVTTAITRYGFEVGGFEFGLGPYAITPLIEPPLLSRGDRNYPPESETFLVLGASINGDARAYGKLDIVRHEVVDEFIGGVPVAVAY
jgi:hypothetical protein